MQENGERLPALPPRKFGMTLDGANDGKRSESPLFSSASSVGSWADSPVFTSRKSSVTETPEQRRKRLLEEGEERLLRAGLSPAVSNCFRKVATSSGTNRENQLDNSNMVYGAVNVNEKNVKEVDFVPPPIPPKKEHVQAVSASIARNQEERKDASPLLTGGENRKVLEKKLDGSPLMNRFPSGIMMSSTGTPPRSPSSLSRSGSVINVVGGGDNTNNGSYLGTPPRPRNNSKYKNAMNEGTPPRPSTGKRALFNNNSNSSVNSNAGDEESSCPPPTPPPRPALVDMGGSGKFKALMSEREQAPSLLGKILSYGIRLAVGQDELQPKRNTNPNDYNHSVPHQPYLELDHGKGVGFRFTDWYPVVFRNLRTLQGISFQSFVDSVGKKPLLGGGEGSGKSGARFFKSADKKYIIKEVKKSERDTLQRILPSYVNYLARNQYSFLPRFLGLYTIEPVPGVLNQAMTIVVMVNSLQFPTRRDSHPRFSQVFDLKGSVHNRFTSSPSQSGSFSSLQHADSGEEPLSTQKQRLPRTMSVDCKEAMQRSSATRQQQLSMHQKSLQRTQSSPVKMSEKGNNSFNECKDSIDVDDDDVEVFHDEDNDNDKQLNDNMFTPVTRRSSTGMTRPNSDGGVTIHANNNGNRPVVLKDLNLRCKFVIGPKRKSLLFCQLQYDVEWLEKHNLMDYSLLLGVQSRDNFNSPIVGSSKSFQSDLSEVSVSTPDSVGNGGGLSSVESSPVTSVASSSVPFPNIQLDLDDEDEEDAVSEIGALLKRNEVRRRESAALIPEGSLVNIKLVGHGEAKRSRESSTFFRQNCTQYTFVVSRYASNTPEKTHEWVVFRRYKDFEKLFKGLQEELKSANSTLKLPSLPKKQMIGFMDPDFVRKREHDLEQYIQTILDLVGHEINSPALHNFLTLKANRCPPKWKAQDQLKKVVQRKDSVDAIVSGKINPNSPSREEVWRSLGGESHQNIVAQRIPLRTGRPQDCTLHLGIIDILQEFNLSKKLESVFKGLTAHADGISSVDPERYGERFLTFVDEFVFE